MDDGVVNFVRREKIFLVLISINYSFTITEGM